ncbi:CamS family sex pheromone protein, partial [Thomasclavelia cocleata]
TNESDINGRYILKSFCENSVGSIDTLNYHNYMFSSEEATAVDEETASQFEIFKSNMKKAATEAVGVIGYGRYKDGTIQSMNIKLNVNVKTYEELIYLVSTAADEIDNQFTGFDIKVLVHSQDDLEAIIIKEQGEKAKSSLLY